LLAASAVILGHAFYLSPRPGSSDPVLRLTQINHSGGLAVSVFFFLSGLLVFESFHRTKSVPLFFAARVARIFPGLSVCLIFSVLVVGPLFGSLSFSDYISAPETLSYYQSNLLLFRQQSTLPGVFSHSPNPLNGCLWTLPIEIRLYLVIGLFGGAGLFRKRSISNVFLGGLIAAYFLSFDHIPDPQRGFVDGIRILNASFILGCLVAVNKDIIKLTSAAFIVLLIVSALTWKWPTRPIFFYITLYYASLYLFSTPWSLRIKLPGDYSYGIYIYGFVVQQCVASLQVVPNPWVNSFISLLVTLVLASLSWHLVERPAMRLLKASPEYCVQILSAIRMDSKGPIRNFVMSAIVFSLMVVPAIIPIRKNSSVLTYRSDLRIVSIGPAVITAGVDFNFQSNGQSAMLIYVSRPVDKNAAILLAGVPLVSSSTGTVIVGFVPRRFYANPGSLTLAVQEPMLGGGIQISEERVFPVIAAQ